MDEDLSGLSPGDYNVIVSDGMGCSTSLDVTIITMDNEAPVITSCPPVDIVLPADLNFCGKFITHSLDITDNCELSTVVATAPASIIPPTVSPGVSLYTVAGNFPVGTTEVTVTATDASGNPETCVFDVVIQDTQAPVLQMGTCPDNITVNDTDGDCMATATWLAPSFTDNCSSGGGSFMVTSDYDPGDTFTGSTTVTYTATDGSPQSPNTTCSFVVTVTSTPTAVDDVNTPAVSPGTNAVVNVVTNDIDCDTNIDASTVDFGPAIAGLQTIMTVPGEGEWDVAVNGEVTFAPEGGFTIDPTSITYVVSDGSGNTSNEATITADYVPVASDDLSDNNNAGPVVVDVLINDTGGDYVDPATVQIASTAGIGLPLVITGEGTWSVNGATGAITFTPDVALVGNPTPIMYTVNDDEGNPSNPALVTVEYTLCVEIEAWVYLEGSAIAPNGSSNYSIPMRSELNDKKLLPGQFSSSPLGSYYSPPGQPYSAAPWNYMGTEGLSYDSDEMAGNAAAGYDSDVVDWVLVSLRDKVVDPFNLSGDYKPDDTPICTAAALLHADGSIEFIDEFTCCELNVAETYYLVIEHRNHLLVSSHEPVSIVNGVLSYDFRSQQSYIQIAFGSPNGSGQLEINPGEFVMHAGNGDQAPDPTADTFIGFGDEAYLKSEYGQVLRYLNGDYNMNGSPNSLDRILWGFNNGKSSAVPRN
jgi:CshA-type fibril repeat protein